MLTDLFTKLITTDKRDSFRLKHGLAIAYTPRKLDTFVVTISRIAPSKPSEREAKTVRDAVGTACENAGITIQKFKTETFLVIGNGRNHNIIRLTFWYASIVQPQLVAVAESGATAYAE